MSRPARRPFTAPGVPAAMLAVAVNTKPCCWKGWRPVLDIPTALASEIRLVSNDDETGRHPASGMFGRPLFNAQDVPGLVKVSGLRPVQGTIFSTIADALCFAFGSATFLARLNTSESDLDDQFRKIERSARNLLQALGYESRGTWEAFPGRFPSPLDDLIGRSTGQFRTGETTRDMREVGRFLTRLADLARTAERYPDQEQPRTGKQPKLGVDELFKRLAGTFFATFGLEPIAGRKDTFNEQPGQLWAAAVLTLARERFANSNQEQEPERQRLFDQLAEINGPRTIADRMQGGWKQWVALPEEERWFVPVWHPAGHTPGDTGAPEWLSLAGIRAPTNDGVETSS